MRSRKTRALVKKRDANIRVRAVRVVLLVLFYNGAIFLDSFRFGPVHYPRRRTKVIRSLSHASAKTESENNRRAAQGTVTEMHPAAH